jgi:hypothetical protein
MDDKEFATQFGLVERKVAPTYFAAMLDRAKRWHEALAATGSRSDGVSFYVVGGDCKPALDAIVIYRDTDDSKWKTVFRPNGFKRSDGVKISDDELKKIMLAPGDGTVTRRSLEAENSDMRSLGVKDEKLFCESHNKLPDNDQIQDYIIGLLKREPATAEAKRLEKVEKKD